MTNHMEEPAHRMIVAAFYERYRHEQGSADLPETEAILFADYLLDHLEEFYDELEEYLKNFRGQSPDNAA